MKCISKTKLAFLDNSGETIVEVLVAFTLLSIMLVAFSQGLSWATTTVINATESRESADRAMGKLQKTLIGQSVEGVVSDQAPSQIHLGEGVDLYEYTYIVDNYTYVVYKPINTTQSGATG